MRSLPLREVSGRFWIARLGCSLIMCFVCFILCFVRSFAALVVFPSFTSDSEDDDSYFGCGMNVVFARAGEAALSTPMSNSEKSGASGATDSRLTAPRS